MNLFFLSFNTGKISLDPENKVLKNRYFIQQIKRESELLTKPFYSSIQPHLVDRECTHQLQSFCKIRC